jgi:hypothetical protein
LITAPFGARFRAGRQAAAGDQCLVAREDNVVVEHFRPGNVLAQRVAIDRARVERKQIGYLGQGARNPPA